MNTPKVLDSLSQEESLRLVPALCCFKDNVTEWVRPQELVSSKGDC